MPTVKSASASPRSRRKSANPKSLLPAFSFVSIIFSSNPRKAAIDRLVSAIEDGFSRLKLTWCEEAFRKGLDNADLPREAVTELEALLSFSQSVSWNLPDSLKEELEDTVEVIEAHNPEFIAAIEESRKESGKFGAIPSKEVAKRLGIS